MFQELFLEFEHTFTINDFDVWEKENKKAISDVYNRFLPNRTRAYKLKRFNDKIVVSIMPVNSAGKNLIKNLK